MIKPLVARYLRKRPALMVVMVVVMLINVGIWTLPDASGEAPAQRDPG